MVASGQRWDGCPADLEATTRERWTSFRLKCLRRMRCRCESTPTIASSTNNNAPDKEVGDAHPVERLETQASQPMVMLELKLVKYTGSRGQRPTNRFPLSNER